MRTQQRLPLARASDIHELRRLISQLNIEVPLRTEGRRSEHVERYAIVHLLLSIPASRFQFPLLVDHGDRPDFLITDGQKRIAIEHVEAITTNEAKKSALREQGDDSRGHFVSHSTPGEGERSTKRLLKEIEADEPGDGWVGDSPEREWADAMAYFALGKAGSVTLPGYDRGDETWLLIYDNWPVPHVVPDTAARYFLTDSRLPAIFAVFGRVYVLNGVRMWEFTADHYEHHLRHRPTNMAALDRRVLPCPTNARMAAGESI